MTPYEKIRGQKYRKEILPLEEQVLARRPGANVNQLMQPRVTGLWLGRDTLGDEHLIGTAAGVMRSRAVRRLQEPNLPGRPRLQRPAYEELIEAGTLPRFIEIPTAPTKNPKSEPPVQPQTRQYGNSWSTDTEICTSVISRRERGQYPKTSKTNRGEHSVGNRRW